MRDALLLFVGREAALDGWLRLADGAVAARGTGLEGPPEIVDGLRVVAVVPGEDVSLHWLELPTGLAPAQAVAAARLTAAEVSAQAIGEMHVAVGREEDAGALRSIALAPILAMTEWLARLQASGFDPDMVVPEPLLLDAPEEGVLRYGSLFRGPSDGFALEPGLAELVLAGTDVREIDTAAFEAGLGEALERLPVNLRQGMFAKKRRWTIDWARVRRLILLGAAILLVTVAIQIAAIYRYVRAADALEAETARIAAGAVPGRAETVADMDRRVAELRGGGIGYSAIVSAVFGAVQATANVELSGMVIERDGSLKASVTADSPATISALSSRLEQSGLTVQAGAARAGGGRQASDLIVRPR